jgi:tetratricopeptide (TPR) repeat protein
MRLELSPGRRTECLVRLVAALAIGLGLAGAPLAGSRVAAQSPSVLEDRVQVVSVRAEPVELDAPAPPGSPVPAAAVRFSIAVDYRLQSASIGFLLPFVFEGDSDTANEDSAHGLRVTSGAGRATLSTTYRPNPGVQTLSVLIGLFDSQEHLLAWGATTPISLAPLPARLAFSKAMAARSEGNHAQAAGWLSTAIALEPATLIYYYWRADSEVRLGQLDQAIADYSYVLAAAPQDRASLLGRGIARLWAGDWQLGLADLDQVVATGAAPDRLAAWALRARGVAYAALGQRPQAIASYQAYLAAVPDATDRAQIESWITGLQAGGDNADVGRLDATSTGTSESSE